MGEGYPILGGDAFSPFKPKRVIGTFYEVPLASHLKIFAWAIPSFQSLPGCDCTRVTGVHGTLLYIPHIWGGAGAGPF